MFEIKTLSKVNQNHLNLVHQDKKHGCLGLPEMKNEGLSTRDAEGCLDLDETNYQYATIFIILLPPAKVKYYCNLDLTAWLLTRLLIPWLRNRCYDICLITV